ncbi:hypothetical protein [Nitrincola schmidtii]|uniref:hypothetical protein n=1 Tax=Nitrincola schmidtii TaxID=1730894 RepID=UPI00124D846C|nr:hypothetical protein [Nitrincola schmidtii]
MRTPSFERINKTKHSGKIYFAGSRPVHPNPTWFKYYWWIFTAESPIDGHSFLSDENKLTFFEYERELERFKGIGLEAWVYNIKLHRLVEGSPFDETKLRARGINDFAPAFYEDKDPVTSDGFK